MRMAGPDDRPSLQLLERDVLIEMIVIVIVTSFGCWVCPLLCLCIWDLTEESRL